MYDEGYSLTIRKQMAESHREVAANGAVWVGCEARILADY
jgi:hypothetical protein